MNYEMIKNAKILLVDDQPLNLRVLCMFLNQINGNIFMAKNGNEALKIAEKEKPEVIIMDVMMPDMDGYEVCKRIKDNPELVDIPIIFMSALGDTDSILKGFDVGGVDYITKPLKHQEAIARISAHLNIRRMEEERRKLHAQLMQARKVESLSIMAGGIAHNFNNILMGILGYAELALMEVPEDSPLKHSIEEVINSGRRAAAITRQILDYAGGGKFLPVKMDLSTTIRGISHLLEVTMSKKDILVYELSDNLPFVKCDSILINQLVLNLVTNAFEALPNGEGIITIRTGNMECDESYIAMNLIPGDIPSGNYVYLEIEDTGCGISEEIKEKIFDPFFTTKFTGRGLGLAAVYGIINIHHGAINVVSEVDKGTTIRLFFPIFKE